MARRKNREQYALELPFPWWGWGLIIFGTILRLILAQTLELRTDEAYYWTQSKEWVLSTLDHPPLSLWFIKLGTLIFGDTNLGVRVPFIVAYLLSQILMIKSVQALARDPKAIIFAIISSEAIPLFGHMGFWAGPDGALVLFSMLVIFTLIKLDLTGEGSLWLLVGLFAGLACLAKYTAIFLAPAVFAFILINRRNRKFLLSPYLWLSASIAFFIFSPVLIWNAINDWASFRFQGVRTGEAGSLKLITFFDFIGLEMMVIGILLFPFMVWAAFRMFWRGLYEKNSSLVLLTLAVLVPLSFFLLRSFTLRINVTWGIIFVPPMLIISALYLDILDEMNEWLASFTWGFARLALFLSAIFTLACFFTYAVDNKARLGVYDPIGKEAGFGELSEKLVAEMVKRRATYAITTDYRTYAMLKWYLKDQPLSVVQLNERSRYIGFRPIARGRIDDQRGIHIVPESKNNPAPWVHIQTSRERIGTIDRLWRGVKYESYGLDLVAPFKPDLTPLRSSPLFTPRNLI